MIAEAPLVWLAPEAPGAEAQRALDAWAIARGVRLVTPAEPTTAELTLDLAAADRVEQEIEHAREAIAAQDADAADRALARAERELFAHPELPQAAWLLAEVERAWAVRFARVAPIDAERAERAWARAAALDGGRASGVGEPHAAAAPTVKARILSTTTDVALTLDGVPIAAGAIERAAGAHQIVVTRDGKTAWAAWVTLAEGTVVALPDFAGVACSANDLARARFVADAIDARGVRCPRWIAALPLASLGGADSATVRVATCEGDRCGPLLEWRAPRGGDFLPVAPPTTTTRWPVWGTWTLVGAGAVAVGVVAIVASGVFQPTHSETHFVNGGIKAQRVTFPF
jgi:hypothetical protein